jgi:hypothetical protein
MLPKRRRRRYGPHWTASSASASLEILKISPRRHGDMEDEIHRSSWFVPISS